MDGTGNDEHMRATRYGYGSHVVARLTTQI
jgi:hypothetical protein